MVCTVNFIRNALEFTSISYNEWLMHILCNVWSDKGTLFFALICLSESDKRLSTTKDLSRATHSTLHITINLNPNTAYDITDVTCFK